MSEREFRLIKEQLTVGSRQFLVRQGNHSVVCQLDLKGLDGELAVISGRAQSVERLHTLIEQLGPDPQHWLPIFMTNPDRIRTIRSRHHEAPRAYRIRSYRIVLRRHHAPGRKPSLPSLMSRPSPSCCSRSRP